LLQNVQPQPKIFSANLINQINQESDDADSSVPVKETIDKAGKESYTQVK
jgi:hypothetical protein